MKVELSCSELIEFKPEDLWKAIIDPEVLKKCIPGCKDVIAVSHEEYSMKLNLKVGAVGGSFEGKIKLSNFAKSGKGIMPICIINN